MELFVIDFTVCVHLFLLQSLLTEWRRVFWITFAVHISEAVVFTVWGSAVVQPWNSIEVKKDKERKRLELDE